LRNFNAYPILNATNPARGRERVPMTSIPRTRLLRFLAASGLALLTLAVLPTCSAPGSESGTGGTVPDLRVLPDVRPTGPCRAWADWNCQAASDGVSNGCLATCGSFVMKCNIGRGVCGGFKAACVPPKTTNGCEGCRWILEECAPFW